jgi:hypothetical protein
LYCTECTLSILLISFGLVVIPSKYDLSKTINTINWITFSLWGFLLLMSMVGLCFADTVVGRLARGVVSPPGFRVRVL